MIRVITGAGERVGKTVACAVLARADHDRGLNVAYLKPVQSGLAPGEPGDAEFVRIAAMVNGSEGYRFETMLDPAVAAEQAASAVSMDWLANRTRAMSGTVDVLYVETTGGFLTPITGTMTMADLATQLGAEVIIVTRPGIGALNTAALTLEAVRSRALGFVGFVVSCWPETPGVVERTTLERLGRMGTILGVIPEVGTIDTRAPSSLPAGLELRRAS